MTFPIEKLSQVWLWISCCKGQSCPVFFLFCFIQAMQASDICLLLTPTEEAALLRAQEAARKAEQAQKPVSLTLNGIIFRDDKTWTVWLNSRPMVSGESSDNIQILDVSPDAVELVWNPDSAQSHHITLKPNDVFKLKERAD